MMTVKAMTIIVDSLLPRPKLDCDEGYDMAMKGSSVVVTHNIETMIVSIDINCTSM